MKHLLPGENVQVVPHSNPFSHWFLAKLAGVLASGPVCTSEDYLKTNKQYE